MIEGLAELNAGSVRVYTFHLNYGATDGDIKNDTQQLGFMRSVTPSPSLSTVLWMGVDHNTIAKITETHLHTTLGLSIRAIFAVIDVKRFN